MAFGFLPPIAPNKTTRQILVFYSIYVNEVSICDGLNAASKVKILEI